MAAATLTDRDEYPLSERSGTDVTVEDGNSIVESPLPLADRGKSAYLSLLSCAVLQLPIWGFQVAYGVFQNYETSHNDVSGDPSIVGVTGTTLTGVLYVSMPFFSAFLAKYVRLRTKASILGSIIASTSLVIASFSTHVWHFVCTLGILHPLGCSLLYMSSSLCLDTWFIQRKGLAFGTTLSSKAGFGTVAIYILNVLLNSLGFPNALRLWAGITFITSIIPALILRSRIPPQPTREDEPAERPRKIVWSFLRRRTFWIHQSANAIFATGYGLPITYITTYATRTLHLDSTVSSSMLAILAAPSVVASVCFGLLCDGKVSFKGRALSIQTVTAISALGAAIPVFFLWGFSANVAVLSLFSVTYGFFAGGFSSTWSGMMKDIARESAANDEAVDTGLVFGLLNGGRGVGFIVGGLIAVELLKTGSVSNALGNWGYHSAYGAMILFTGFTTLFGGWGLIWKAVGPLLR